MKVLAIALCSYGLLACSSSPSGPGSTGNAQVAGKLGAQSFVPADAIAYP